MKYSFYIKLLRMLCPVLLVAWIASTLCLGAGAQNLSSYTVTVDQPQSVSAVNMPVVIRNAVHGTDPTLTVTGWIKTDENIACYEFTMDGGKTWERSTAAVQSRPDVKSHCPNTYQTAGFYLNINVSEYKRGFYDLFLRAYTENGNVIDVLAMLDVSIGNTDLLTMSYRELNLEAFGAQNGILSLHANTPLSLDAYNLREYQSMEFILDRDVALRVEGEAELFSATTVSAQNEDGTFCATANIKGNDYAGGLVVKAQESVRILRIRLYTPVPDYYKGELNVHMTATPYEYLSGANCVDAMIMADDTVGTYIRLFPTKDTNDPYIYFNLGNYLKDTQGAQISADHYTYAVLTLQAPPTNSQGPFRLFLCAGEIRGPHGDSHVAFSPTNDGQWHRYVIPLCEEENWHGGIYGMRFDFIDSHAITSDYANIASISLHPDKQSAKEAAKMPFEVYHEQGKAPTDQYAEQGRAPSGRADAITWFDASLSECFSGENKSSFSFDEYGHVILQSNDTFNDPFVSFDLQKYALLTGQSTLRAEDYSIIVLRVLADEKIDGKGFTLYYYSGGFDFAKGDRAITSMYEGGEWEYLVYDMTDRLAWTDEILGMRLDFAQQINAGQRVCLADMLFFADMNAWKSYALENGIECEQDDPLGSQEDTTTAPETEIPTIEIPTQGPGLEYIPPQNETTPTPGTQSCNSVLTLPICLILPALAAVIIQKTHKKRS